MGRGATRCGRLLLLRRRLPLLLLLLLLLLRWRSVGGAPWHALPAPPLGATPPPAPAPQISGHIKKEDGTPVYALEGMWNEYLVAVKCDEEGDPLPDAEKLELWRVRGRRQGFWSLQL